jgi:tetratricopeptide (TPR) repeat protein
VSQLLESLRRSGRAEARVTGAAWRPSADLILARMGYARDTRGRARAFLLIVAAGLAILLVWAGLALRGAPAPAPEPGTSAPPDRATAPQTQLAVPARPPSQPLTVAPSVAAAPQAARQGEMTAESVSVGGSQFVDQRSRGAVQNAPATTSEARIMFAQALDLERAGDPGRAEALYRRMISQGALLPAAHNNLGLLLQARGDLDGAARELEAAIRHHPGSARAHNNLGVVRLAQERPLEAAERFRLAAELDPRDPGALVNLALAERDAGLPERAKESLLRALVLSPDSALAHYNLAVLFDRSGEPGRAAHHYRAFLEHAGAEHAAHASSVRARLEALERSR